MVGALRTAMVVAVILPLEIRSSVSRSDDTREAVSALKAMAEVYGPTRREGPSFDYFFFSADLDGDANPEIIVTMQNQERGLDPPNPGIGVGISVLCDGFAVFTEAAGRPWPVFYAYDVYDGFAIRLEHLDGDPFPSIVCDTDNNGQQMAWGWHDDHEFPAGWAARYRNWDDGMNAFALPWLRMDYVYVVEGK